MKIKMESNALILAFLWIIVAILNITIVIILHSNRSFLAVIAPMMIIAFVFSLFNSINLFKLYDDFLTLTEDSIIVNYGLIYRKKVLKLHEIKNVRYNKSNMTFYMADGARKNISLTFISKGDELALYRFLTSNSIRITM